MLADLAEVDAALHPGVSGLLETLKKFRPADLGRDLSRRDLAEALDDRRAAQMLGAAHPAAASNVLETLDAERATRVVSFLPMDCQVAILGGMDAASRARVEAAVDPAEKAAVDHVLSHGPSSVARLMTPRSRRVTKTATVGEALARLRGRRGRRAEASIPNPIVLAPEEAPEAIVLGDENKLRQVITNLMGNAVRFSPAGSPIELVVSVDAAAGTTSLAVVDHGDGIPDQLKKKIFERFFRADSSRARDTGGSGLGLAIVASIVGLHRGRVDVLDTPGGGATFRVTLPLAEPTDLLPSGTAATDAPPASAPPAGSPPTA